MVFSSLLFLAVFLPITLAGYYLLDRKYKNYFLLIVSLVFYAWGAPDFLPVMFISIFVNYFFGLCVDKFREKKSTAKLIIVLMVLWNVGIFFVYKYLNFTITNFNSIFKQDLPLTNFTLPIGISFFTFQAISYVIDVYRENGKVQKNPFNVALYITFFPQLIAGPIVRYETIANEIMSRKETLDDFVEGIKRFAFGLGKKVIISNLVAVAADTAFNTSDYSELSVAMSWFGAFAYSIQILFDFSGYSDMAIGLGKMFGFHFNENFDYPYTSSSVSEFWRRWHISLGTWFRDYVYFPLGGSRVKSKGRLVFNLFVTWMLTGIWHGASWNFIAWGFFYFALLTFEKLTGITKKLNQTWQEVLYRIFTLLCVIFGWVVFRAPGLRAGMSYIKSMFGLSDNPLVNQTDSSVFVQYITIIIIGVILSTPIMRIIKKKLSDKHSNAAFIGEICICAAVFVVAYAMTAGSTYNPFIYFNF